MDDEDVFINTYARTEPIDAVIKKAMDMTWNEGLAELDAFFDTSAGVEQPAVATENAGVGAAVAVEEAREEVQAMLDAELAGGSSAPVTMTENVAFGQEETAEAGHGIKNASPAISNEEDDPQTDDHVAPLPVNDATSIRLPGQPHFTETATSELAESYYEKPEEMQDTTAAPTSTRARKDSMNISFLINEEDEPQQTTTTTNGVEEVPSIPPGAVAGPAVITTSKTSPASTISSAGLPPQLSFTETTSTPEQNTTRATSETPHRPRTEMHPPSSEGKSSLMDEMLHEEEHAYFKQSGSAMRGAEKRSTPLDDDSLVTTGDENSLADAPGSPDSRMGPMDLRERLREAVGEDEDAAVDDRESLDQDSLADAEGSTVSSSDIQNLPHEIAQDEGTGLNDENKEAESSLVHSEKDIALPEQADSQGGDDVVTGTADAARVSLQQIVQGILGDRAKNGAAADPTHAADSVGMLEPAPAPPAQIAEADAEPQNAEHEQQAPLTDDVEMSEDELASSSPRTLPRKRKSDVDGDSTLTSSAHATKKAKTTNTNVAAPTAENEFVSKLKPQKKSTKKANAAKLSSKSKNPHGRTRKSTGVKELKALTGMFTSSGGESGDAEIAAANGVGGRKTRAQIETEKKAQPNAAGAVRARRKGA